MFVNTKIEIKMSGLSLCAHFRNQYFSKIRPHTSIFIKILNSRSYIAIASERKLLRNLFFPGKIKCKRAPKSLKLIRIMSSYNKVVNELVSGSRPEGLTYASDQVVTEKINDVTLIAINRPDSRNAVNRQTAQQLKQAFLNFDKDKYAHVAVLYGKGGTFCAGYDLKELSSGNVDLLAEPPAIPFGPMGPSPLQISKPVIAAVNGHAVAGGLELSLLCDMRVAEESAVFGVFCRRFGVPLIDGGTVRLSKLIGLSRAMDMILKGLPIISAGVPLIDGGTVRLPKLIGLSRAMDMILKGLPIISAGVPLIDGGTVRLPKLIGLSRAMDMILTGRAVKADEALSFGLVNRVVPDGQALEKAIELAKQIAMFPQRCLRADRLSTYYSTYEAESFQDAMDFEYKTGSPVIVQESVQGAGRFAKGQGRKGSFDDFKPKL